MVAIRSERAEDEAGVRAALLDAFENADEADLVDALRECGALRLARSMVATEDGRVVGYAGVVGVELDDAPDAPVVTMAPVAVATDRQRTGIGSRLVRTGLEACDRDGCVAVFLEGDPAYYERFGFESAAAHGFVSDPPAPPEAFQVYSCRATDLARLSGIVRHPRPFHDLH